MTARNHIFCVPFPGGGHGINMLNVAHVLGTADMPVHVLVMSVKEGQKWEQATGQEHNPHISIEALGDGRWEDWHPSEPKELVGSVRSPEFDQAVGDAIKQVQAQHPQDRMGAVVFNGLMSGLTAVYKGLGMKGFLLMPGPYYMMRLGMAMCAGDNADTAIVYKGIGGSGEDMHAQLGDAIELTGPMFQMFAGPMNACDGTIYSNTNLGLEGMQYEQKHMNHNNVNEKVGYFIGPILPPWLEFGLDRPQLLKQKEREASVDECIQFMNKQQPKSVVYIAMGSHAQMSIEQAKLLVDSLRKHNTRWILLFREHTAAMLDALDAPFDDGVVTSWAPQMAVMAHPALKCVVSHGGFGTMIEGVYAGAPFITSPIASDQFLDTKVMTLLGICLGSIAENRRVDLMTRKVLSPFFPDDGGKAIDDLFGRVFGSEQGERELEQARAASRALRRRMVESKEKDGPEQLAQLRAAIAER